MHTNNRTLQTEIHYQRDTGELHLKPHINPNYDHMAISKPSIKRILSPVICHKVSRMSATLMLGSCKELTPKHLHNNKPPLR